MPGARKVMQMGRIWSNRGRSMPSGCQRCWLFRLSGQSCIVFQPSAECQEASVGVGGIAVRDPPRCLALPSSGCSTVSTRSPHSETRDWFGSDKFLAAYLRLDLENAWFGLWTCDTTLLAGSCHRDSAQHILIPNPPTSSIIYISYQ